MQGYKQTLRYKYQLQAIYSNKTVQVAGQALHHKVTTSSVFHPCSSCTWTNPQVGGSVSCTAQAYLCQNGIITSTQDGNYSTDFHVQRNQLARIIYQALYGTGNHTTLTDNFPPFNDMQSATAQNAYWYYAAKSLCYLEYGDGVSPFSRDFFNFRTADNIERRYAMKSF